jgi:ATP-dependent Clp protease ATP-binding subunit ClpA
VLKKKNIELSIAPETQKMLALSSFDPKYGARQITGTIRQRIRRPISKMIVAGEINPGDKIEVRHNENDDLIWKR